MPIFFVFIFYKIYLYVEWSQNWEEDGSKSNIGIGNMKCVSVGSHFVLPATDVDGLFIHVIYTTDGLKFVMYLILWGAAMLSLPIYINTTHDNTMKLGSDCSLGFSRVSENIIVRNIIADTGCKVFG